MGLPNNLLLTILCRQLRWSNKIPYPQISRITQVVDSGSTQCSHISKVLLGLFLHLFTMVAVIHFNMASLNSFCSRKLFITWLLSLFKRAKRRGRTTIWISRILNKVDRSDDCWRLLMVGFCFSCPYAYLCIWSCDRWNCFLSGMYCFLSGTANLGWSCWSWSSVEGEKNLGWNMSGDLDGGEVGTGILEELELESEVIVTRDSKPLSSSFDMAE